LVGEEDDEMYEKCFEGKREIFVDLILKSNGLVYSKFIQLPEGVSWTMRMIKNKLVPVLSLNDNYNLMLPSLSIHSNNTNVIAIPDPENAIHPGVTSYLCSGNLWFENCGDGGVYILGIDNEVLLFYLDSPGGIIYSSYKAN
jgi:hypothetical protein